METKVGISIDVVLPEEPRDILDENTKNRPEWLIECHDGDGVPKATNDYLSARLRRRVNCFCSIHTR